jgi:hypothetical protein
MNATEITCVCEIIIIRRRKKKNRRFWVHPVVSQRLCNGQFYKLYESLTEHPQKFFRYFRMSYTNLNKLLAVFGDCIAHQNTHMRLAVPVPERLAVTLR